MALRRIAVLAFLVFWLSASAVVYAESPKENPSFLHGMAQMVDGIVFELPKNILDGTLTGPPVAGTLIGALGGTARALQKTAAGFFEAAAGFDPWGTKKKEY